MHLCGHPGPIPELWPPPTLTAATPPPKRAHPGAQAALGTSSGFWVPSVGLRRELCRLCWEVPRTPSALPCRRGVAWKSGALWRAAPGRKGRQVWMETGLSLMLSLPGLAGWLAVLSSLCLVFTSMSAFHCSYLLASLLSSPISVSCFLSISLSFHLPASIDLSIYHLSTHPPIHPSLSLSLSLPLFPSDCLHLCLCFSLPCCQLP